MATLTINCSPLVLSLSNIHTRKEGEKSAQKENAKALGHPVAIATQEQTAPLSNAFVYLSLGDYN